MKLLNENPNEITINNKIYDWNTSGVITFAIDSNISQCFVDFRTIHAELIAKQSRKGLISKEDIDNGNWNRRKGFHGRIWERPRVISFWNQPSSEQLNKIINLLEQTDRFISKLRIKETFKIEISEGDFMPVKDYLAQNEHQENDFDQSIAHITPGMTTKNKELYKNNVYNNRDKKLGNMSAAEYNALKRPFSENNLHETPDQIDVYHKPLQPEDGHYRWDSPDAIAFIADEDLTDIFAGEWSHSDIMDDIFDGKDIDELEGQENWISRRRAFHGRLWTEPKVISFWKQPTPQQLIKIVNMLKNKYDFMDNIDIINDYQIELSYDPYKNVSTIQPVSEYIKGEEIDKDNNFDKNILHLKNADDKRQDPQMQAYLKNRSSNQSDKLGTSNNSREVSPAEYNYYKRYGMGENQEHVSEGTINDVASNHINLKSFEPKSELNPKFWINDKLNSRVRLKLLDIADDFINELAINWIKPKDIIFTGSLANYNWSKYSDIDVHILINYNDVYENHDFVEDYFKAKKDLWLEEHPNLKIYGFPVEIYVEDINNESVSTGIYSLEKNQWLIEPGDIQNVSLNEKYIKKIAAKLMTRIDNIAIKLKNEQDNHKIELYKNELHKIFDKIKNLRKEGLKKNGEMSSGNIVFKIIRRTNYFDKLWDLINTSYDKLNSIKENKSRKTIIITEEQFNHIKKGL